MYLRALPCAGLRRNACQSGEKAEEGSSAVPNAELTHHAKAGEFGRGAFMCSTCGLWAEGDRVSADGVAGCGTVFTSDAELNHMDSRRSECQRTQCARDIT